MKEIFHVEFDISVEAAITNYGVNEQTHRKNFQRKNGNDLFLRKLIELVI